MALTHLDGCPKPKDRIESYSVTKVLNKAGDEGEVKVTHCVECGSLDYGKPEPREA